MKLKVSGQWVFFLILHFHESFVDKRDHTMSNDVKSRCINVCKYDEESVCIGCHRTMDEITGWLFMDNRRKLQVLHDAHVRKSTPKKGKADYDRYAWG